VTGAPLCAGAADAPRDFLCSQAVPHLVEFNAAAKTTDLTKVAAAARGAADA
jgi:hypothetical protein